jgi:hypothetical protein
MLEMQDCFREIYNGRKRAFYARFLLVRPAWATTWW